jgi:hypothetical protein
MQQVARVVSSMKIGATLSKVGKKNYIIIGFSLMVCSNLGFSLIGFFPKNIPILFFIACMILNFI